MFRVVIITIIGVFFLVTTSNANTIYDFMEETPEPQTQPLTQFAPPVAASKNANMKSLTLSGKYDFNSNGADSAFDVGLGLFMPEYIYYSKYFVPEMKCSAGIKDNEVQTSWNVGVTIMGYGPVLEMDNKQPLIFPFVSVGGGYQDANNVNPAIFYNIGAGIDIPTHIESNMDNIKSVLEVGYNYYHASKNIYYDNSQLKNHDELLTVALKLFWK